MNKTENKKKEDILKKAKKIVSIEGWSSEIFSKLQKQNIEKNDLFYFFPDGYKDLLEYSLQKIQTKERYLEHRLYRNIEARNASGLEDFIEIYQKHLATKKPFKTFFYSKALASWCASEDIFFKSEENCRINKDLMVKAWNKKYPAEKINDKKKK